jgi:ankyrin repeat protein
MSYDPQHISSSQQVTSTPSEKDLLYLTIDNLTLNIKKLEQDNVIANQNHTIQDMQKDKIIEQQQKEIQALKTQLLYSQTPREYAPTSPNRKKRKLELTSGENTGPGREDSAHTKTRENDIEALMKNYFFNALINETYEDTLYTSNMKNFKLDPVNIDDYHYFESYTMLHIAAKKGLYVTFKKLIECGADIYKTSFPHQLSVLTLAISTKDKKIIARTNIVKVILEKHKHYMDNFMEDITIHKTLALKIGFKHFLDFADNNLLRPLHHAINNDYVEIVKLLLKAGADFNIQTPEISALDMIIHNKNPEMREILNDPDIKKIIEFHKKPTAQTTAFWRHTNISNTNTPEIINLAMPTSSYENEFF